MHEWIVSAQHSGSKLLAFLNQQLANRFSARQLKRAIEMNHCLINDRIERFANTVLGRGDKITFLLDEQVAATKVEKFNLLNVIYEDNDLLVYNKPAHINCDEDGILKVLKSYNPHLQLMHRLDRYTTGCLIFIKNKQSHAHLLEQFKCLLVKKTYRAIVEGEIVRNQGKIESYLGKKKDYAGQSVWGSVKEGGLRALTAWQRVKTAKGATELLCFPKTGRTHQLRVHLAEMGHPILGDFQYGTFKCHYRPNHYLLHAETINFMHPQSLQEVIFTAPLSEEFLKAQTYLFGPL